MRIAVALAAVVLGSCGGGNTPEASPAPRTGCVVLEFADRTGFRRGSLAADHLERLLRESDRFQVMDRQEFMKRHGADQPDRMDDPLRRDNRVPAVRVERVFVGTISEFRVTADQADLRLELKLVHGTTGEILAQQSSSKTAGVDPESQARLLRETVEEGGKKLLEAIDRLPPGTICRKCGAEVPSRSAACGRCGLPK